MQALSQAEPSKCKQFMYIQIYQCMYMTKRMAWQILVARQYVHQNYLPCDLLHPLLCFPPQPFQNLKVLSPNVLQQNPQATTMKDVYVKKKCLIQKEYLNKNYCTKKEQKPQRENTCTHQLKRKVFRKGAIIQKSTYTPTKQEKSSTHSSKRNNLQESGWAKLSVSRIKKPLCLAGVVHHNNT